MAVVAAPAVERASGVGHAGYALWVFAVPLLLGALVEAPIALLSDRISLRRLVGAGLGVLALSLALCAVAESLWLLSLGLALAGAASGIACGAAQAELVTAQSVAGGSAARAMSRWIAFAAAGDVLTPPLVAAALWLGGSYRSAMAAIAGLIAVHALLVWQSARAAAESVAAGSHDAEAETEAPPVPLLQSLRLAIGRPALWLLLFAAAACLLLDELVVALAALRLHDDLGWSEPHVALAMTGFSAGGLVGAIATERLLGRFTARTVLVIAVLVSLAALALLIAATSSAVVTVALCLLGASAAPHYPLVKAAAYELVPGRPGLVNALSQPFVVFEVVMPLVIGGLAVRHGLGAALAALAVQPLIVLAVACRKRSP